MKEDMKQLFVGGDLSGIQSFLYNISSKKAAVSLKGRSYFLQHYMENVCSKIKQAAEEGGADMTDVIYCSGGKFYMLTDNSTTIVNNIEKCIKQIKKDLWKEHMGQLGISICYIPYQENTNKTVNIEGQKNLKPGCLWKAANADFAKQKSQKFKNILITDYKNFFEPIPVGKLSKVCAITGIESADCVTMGSGKDEIYVLPSVREQIHKGEELRNKQHFKTFEEYAGNTNLGILRMDLDNLGKRINEGFDSIDQYKEFSQRLVGFFENDVERLRQNKAFKDYLNIIYAGGDDLFAIGRWDKIIDFAEQIRQEFTSQFSQEGISISGGIAIVNPKFPIAKSAELAGKAEDSAKDFRNGEKNAISFLGKTISWNEEFAFVKNYKQHFVSLISDYGLSKGILHKLMLYSSIADQNKIKKREGKAEDYSYIWHASYYLTRYMKRYSDNNEVRRFCLQLRDKELNYKKNRNLELIALAARWAELILK